jgi:hypothetical protein
VDFLAVDRYSGPAVEFFFTTAGPLKAHFIVFWFSGLAVELFLQPLDR